MILCKQNQTIACLLYCLPLLCSLIMIFQTKRRRTFLFTPCQTVIRQAGQEGAQQHQRQSQACDLIVVSPLLPLHPHLQHDTE